MSEAQREPTPPTARYAGEVPQELRGPFGPPLGPPHKLTRVRYGELTAISQSLCETLEKMGVQPHEGCTVREITERLWGLR